VAMTPFATGVGGTISGKWDAPEGNMTTTLAAQLPNIVMDPIFWTNILLFLDGGRH